MNSRSTMARPAALVVCISCVCFQSQALGLDLSLAQGSQPGDPLQSVGFPDPSAPVPAVPQEEVTSSRTLGKAEGVSSIPEEPGCYVLMPTGCVNHQSQTNQWKRDMWGEENAGAAYNQKACEDRKSSFDSWCGNGDVRMAFVPGRSPSKSAARPAIPREPGCYVWTPTGCPKQIGFRARLHWKRDTNRAANTSQSACAKRKFSFDSWCGAEDAQTLFVAKGLLPGALVTVHDSSMPPAMTPGVPVTPTEPGCYVWFPDGCSKREFHKQKQWKRDTWGEEHAGAGHSRLACEVERKTSFDSWCGHTGAWMLFVPEAGQSAGPKAHLVSEQSKVKEPKAPTKPGCYVWLPTGCPKHRDFQAATHWKYDTLGHRAATNQFKCESERKVRFNTWCGSSDARTLFIPTRP